MGGQLSYVVLADRIPVQRGSGDEVTECHAILGSAQLETGRTRRI